MRRPQTFHTFSFVGASLSGGRIYSTEESLRVYRTVAFGIELMQGCIDISRSVASQVDAARWFCLVPDVYKQDVFDVVQQVAIEHINYGEILDRDSLHHLVRDLNSEIWKCVMTR